MTLNPKELLREHAGKVLVIGTALLLTLSVVSLAGSLTADGAAEADAQADALISDLSADRDEANQALWDTHLELVSSLPGVDIERVNRDAEPGRSVLLSFVDASASTRDVRATQQLLDERYAFLDSGSRALSDFIPEWMAATGSSGGPGTAYEIGELTIDVISVRSLDYRYVGIARLDPIALDDASTTKSEYLVFAYGTDQDGSITDFDIYRTSSRSRDALQAQAQPEEQTTAVPTPGPTTEPDEDGD